MRSITPTSLKNRIKPALTAQKEEASVIYVSPHSGVLEGTGDRRPSTARLSTRSAKSPRMVKNAYGFLVPEEVPKLKMDASDSFQDSEEEKEKRIDTSWFLTKEEMINYLNDPRRKERKKLNPTEAIYQRGRRHRGFTQVSKGFGSTPSPSPTKSQTGSPTILEESMDSFSKDQSDVDASNDIVSSGRIPDDSFFSIEKPRVPGPVLTYKQLSDIYDRPHNLSKSISKPSSSSSPTAPTVKSTKASSDMSTTAVVTPVSRGTRRSDAFSVQLPRQKDMPTGNKKRSGGKVTKFLANELDKVTKVEKRTSGVSRIASVHQKYIQSLRSSLLGGMLLPFFSLYIRTTMKSLQEIHHDDDINSSNDPTSNLEAIKSMRAALYTNSVLDDIDLINLNKKTEKGQAVLRRRQRALEEELLMYMLDYLSYVDLLELKLVSKSWGTLVYLKSYLSQELILQPADPKIWQRCYEGVKNCNLHDLPTISEDSVNESLLETFVSPKMLGYALADRTKIRHIIATTSSAADSGIDSEVLTPQSSPKRSTPSPRSSNHISRLSPSNKSRSSSSFQRSSLSRRPLPIPVSVYTSLENFNNNAAYTCLRMLSLINVVLDQECIESLKNLRTIETLKLQLVKIRRGGIDATCPNCLKGGYKLVDMILCEQCHSIETACCSRNCYKEYYPVHMKECVVERKVGAYGNDKSISAKYAISRLSGKYKFLAEREKYDSEEEEAENLNMKDVKDFEHPIKHYRTGWLDGHTLKEILEAVGENLTTLSLQYVLPADPQDVKHLFASFNTISHDKHIFGGAPGLERLVIREVYESLVVSPIGLSEETVKKRTKYRKRLTKMFAFGSSSIVSIAETCPNLRFIDMCGPSCNGRMLPMGITLDALNSLAERCRSLTHLGYFTVENAAEFLPIMLHVDNRLNWPLLSSFSCLVSLWNIQHTLRVASGKSWIGDPQWEQHRREHDHRDTFGDGEEEGDSLVDDDVDDFVDVPFMNDLDDRSSSSSSSSDDDDDHNENEDDDENVGRNEGAEPIDNAQSSSSKPIVFNDYTIKNNRGGRDDLSEEEKVDDVSFIQHLVGLTLNAVKYHEVHVNPENEKEDEDKEGKTRKADNDYSGNNNEFIPMKTILLNRRNMKIAFTSEIGKKCAFLPRSTSEGHEEFYITVHFMAGHDTSTNFHVSIDDTCKHCTNISKSFTCHVDMFPCYESRFLGVGEVKQIKYYSSTLNMTEDPPFTYPGNPRTDAASTIFVAGNKMAIKVVLNLRESYASTKLGISSLMNIINYANDNDFIALKIGVTGQGKFSEKQDVIVKIGNKGEESLVEEYEKNASESCTERAVRISSFLDAENASVQDMLKESINILPVCIGQDLSYYTVIVPTSTDEKRDTKPGAVMLQPHRNNSKGRGSILRIKTEVNADSKTGQKEELNDNSQISLLETRTTPFQNMVLPSNSLPVSALIMRIGAFHLNFDPKKRAKAKEREKTRLNQFLKKAASGIDLKITKNGGSDSNKKKSVIGFSSMNSLADSDGGDKMRKIPYAETVSSNSSRLEKAGSNPNLDMERQSTPKSIANRYDCLNCGEKKCTSVEIGKKQHNIPRRGTIVCNICSSTFSAMLRPDDEIDHLVMYWKAALYK